MKEDKEFFKTGLKSIEAKLKENAAEKDKLLVVQNYYLTELGLPVVDTKMNPSNNTQLQPPIPEQTTFSKGDFYGFSQAQAGGEVLKRSGGALTTDRILKTLQDTGYEVGGSNPKNTLYVSLARSRKLVLVASSTFDLAERRPNVKKGKKKKVKKKNKPK